MQKCAVPFPDNSRALNGSADTWIQSSAGKLRRSLADLSKIVATRPDLLQSYAGRDFAFSLANIYVGGLLLDHALSSGNRQDALTVHRWTLRDLTPIVTLAQQNGYELVLML